MKFLEIRYNNKVWVSALFDDSPQNHIPCWYRKNKHTIYVVNLKNKKRKKIRKHYSISRLVKYFSKKLKRSLWKNNYMLS